jgi:AcrR family transcriptional regulator
LSAVRQDDRVAERWTRERRVERTRELLLDAAEEIFARKGFGSAALEDIADAAGYTRGAIYSHFGAKEELFLAVNHRYRERFLEGFADMLAALSQLSDLDLDKIADRWREQVRDNTAQAALGYELTLFLLRNPEARDRVAAQRLHTVESLADFITDRVEQLGGTFRIPAIILARIVMATVDGIVLGTELDGVDLYRPYLEMFMSGIGAPS